MTALLFHNLTLSRGVKSVTLLMYATPPSYKVFSHTLIATYRGDAINNGGSVNMAAWTRLVYRGKNGIFVDDVFQAR